MIKNDISLSDGKIAKEQKKRNNYHTNACQTKNCYFFLIRKKYINPNDKLTNIFIFNFSP